MNPIRKISDQVLEATALAKGHRTNNSRVTWDTRFLKVGPHPTIFFLDGQEVPEEEIRKVIGAKDGECLSCKLGIADMRSATQLADRVR